MSQDGRVHRSVVGVLLVHRVVCKYQGQISCGRNADRGITEQERMMAVDTYWSSSEYSQKPPSEGKSTCTFYAIGPLWSRTKGVRTSGGNEIDTQEARRAADDAMESGQKLVHEIGSTIERAAKPADSDVR